MFRLPHTIPKTQLRRSKIKDYIPGENDKAFQQWLKDWRQKTSEDLYGVCCVKYLGCSNVMTDHTLGQICDAAHQNLIASTDDLYKETRWHLAYERGQTIVNKIKEMVPAVLLPPKTVAIRRCSMCGQPGHNSEFFAKLLSTDILVIFESQNVHQIAPSMSQLGEPGCQTAVQQGHVPVMLQLPRFVLNKYRASLASHKQVFITHECDSEMLQIVSDSSLIQFR